MSHTNVRAADQRDASDLARIYNHYIANTVITFEEQPVTVEDMANRLEDTQAAALPWLVAEHDGAIAGYACASQWKGRCAYRYSVETSVYLDPAMHRRGIGEALYRALITDLIAKNYHALIAGIALPNAPSVRLHEKLGYRKVAHFAEVGRKFNAWVDVGYWQLLVDAGV